MVTISQRKIAESRKGLKQHSSKVLHYKTVRSGVTGALGNPVSSDHDFKYTG